MNKQKKRILNLYGPEKQSKVEAMRVLNLKLTLIKSVILIYVALFKKLISGVSVAFVELEQQRVY